MGTPPPSCSRRGGYERCRHCAASPGNLAIAYLRAANDTAARRGEAARSDSHAGRGTHDGALPSACSESALDRWWPQTSRIVSVRLFIGPRDRGPRYSELPLRTIVSQVECRVLPVCICCWVVLAIAVTTVEASAHHDLTPGQAARGEEICSIGISTLWSTVLRRWLLTRRMISLAGKSAMTRLRRLRLLLQRRRVSTTGHLSVDTGSRTTDVLASVTRICHLQVRGQESGRSMLSADSRTRSRGCVPLACRSLAPPLEITLPVLMLVDVVPSRDADAMSGARSRCRRRARA